MTYNTTTFTKTMYKNRSCCTLCALRSRELSQICDGSRSWSRWDADAHVQSDVNCWIRFQSDRNRWPILYQVWINLRQPQALILATCEDGWLGLHCIRRVLSPSPNQGPSSCLHNGEGIHLINSSNYLILQSNEINVAIEGREFISEMAWSLMYDWNFSEFDFGSSLLNKIDKQQFSNMDFGVLST